MLKIIAYAVLISISVWQLKSENINSNLTELNHFNSLDSNNDKIKIFIIGKLGNYLNCQTDYFNKIQNKAKETQNLSVNYVVEVNSLNDSRKLSKYIKNIHFHEDQDFNLTKKFNSDFVILMFKNNQYEILKYETIKIFYDEYLNKILNGHIISEFKKIELTHTNPSVSLFRINENSFFDYDNKYLLKLDSNINLNLEHDYYIKYPALSFESRVANGEILSNIDFPEEISSIDTMNGGLLLLYNNLISSIDQRGIILSSMLQALNIEKHESEFIELPKDYYKQAIYNNGYFLLRDLKLIFDYPQLPLSRELLLGKLHNNCIEPLIYNIDLNINKKASFYPSIDFVMSDSDLIVLFDKRNKSYYKYNLKTKSLELNQLKGLGNYLTENYNSNGFIKESIVYFYYFDNSKIFLQEYNIKDNKFRNDKIIIPTELIKKANITDVQIIKSANNFILQIKMSNGNFYNAKF